MINRLTNDLIEEVHFHRMLTVAESNDLKLTLTKFDSVNFLKDLSNTNAARSFAKDKKIHVDLYSDNVEITSDRTILRRIIDNMIINALEATPIGGEIKVGCRVNGSNLEFWVHNQGFLSREVQMQIFQRSFSTKGLNRGLGTYSMKLLSSFLDGKVNFLTSKDKGTIFIVNIPLIINK
jgi:signal transduction histidine kinase